MKKLLLLFAIIPALTVHSQRLSADLYTGICNYQGDLQGRFTFENSHFAGGFGLSYLITPHLLARAGFLVTKVSGSDKTNPHAVGIDFRNLSFQSSVKEFHLAVELNLRDLDNHRITPYVFGGGAIMNFNPYIYDLYNNKVYLQPLGTEGQGLPQYPDKKEYKLTQFVVPFGGGLKIALTGNLQAIVEFGMRKMFTDYLDDVSTTYADSALLAQFRGPLSVEYAYRGDELHGAPPYPAAGSKRGNPKNMDSYYISTVRFKYTFNKGSNTRNTRSRTGCPVNVY